MRRIDLAEELGMTPSGITRSLLPMEKIGLVYREPNLQDARSSYVGITESGSRLLHEAQTRLEEIEQEYALDLPISLKDLLNSLNNIEKFAKAL